MMNEFQMDYLNYVRKMSSELQLTVFLTGSMAHGEETNYSDVDILIQYKENKELDLFIKKYRPLLYATYTERPKGICILIYDNGVAVDLDIRKSITKAEKEKGRRLSQLDMLPVGNLIRVENTVLDSFPTQSPYYQFIRLFHRALCKRLSFKYEAAEGLMAEIREGIQQYVSFPIQWNNQFMDDIQHAIRCLYKERAFSVGYYSLLIQLVEQGINHEHYNDNK